LIARTFKALAALNCVLSKFSDFENILKPKEQREAMQDQEYEGFTSCSYKTGYFW